MTDPVAALQHLGLSKYEAEVLVALCRVESATAREVADLTDVPRSQVYGAAEDLADRGLVDVQHGSPRRYRAVSLEDAREQLRRDFEREHERAFDALESLEPAHPEGEERQEEIWTITSESAIDDRVVSFLREAETSVRYGSQPTLYDDAIVDALVETAATATVTVVTNDADVKATFADTPVESTTLPEGLDRGDPPDGRFLVIDDRTVLLSVIDPDGRESAFWSSDTDFAETLVHLLDGHFGDVVDL